jgi:hypothetical protein
MTRAELHRLARLGAEDRLWALHDEIALIHRTFPDLREATRPSNPYTAGVRAAVTGVRPAVEGAVTRRRSKISAAGRKRIGEAAKRRWAEWRERQDKKKGAALAATDKGDSARRRPDVRDSHDRYANLKKTQKKRPSRKKK